MSGGPIGQVQREFINVEANSARTIFHRRDHGRLTEEHLLGPGGLSTYPFTCIVLFASASGSAGKSEILLAGRR